MHDGGNAIVAPITSEDSLNRGRIGGVAARFEYADVGGGGCDGGGRVEGV